MASETDTIPPSLGHTPPPKMRRAHLGTVKPSIIRFLRENYEQTGGPTLRNEVYAHYLDWCRETQQPPLHSAVFGKILRDAFPGLQIARLGARKLSKYHYINFQRRERPITLPGDFVMEQETAESPEQSNDIDAEADEDSLEYPTSPAPEPAFSRKRKWDASQDPFSFSEHCPARLDEPGFKRPRLLTSHETHTDSAPSSSGPSAIFTEFTDSPHEEMVVSGCILPPIPVPPFVVTYASNGPQSADAVEFANVLHSMVMRVLDHFRRLELDRATSEVSTFFDTMPSRFAVLFNDAQYMHDYYNWTSLSMAQMAHAIVPDPLDGCSHLPYWAVRRLRNWALTVREQALRALRSLPLEVIDQYVKLIGWHIAEPLVVRLSLAMAARRAQLVLADRAVMNSLKELWADLAAQQCVARLAAVVCSAIARPRPAVPMSVIMATSGRFDAMLAAVDRWFDGGPGGGPLASVKELAAWVDALPSPQSPALLLTQWEHLCATVSRELLVRGNADVRAVAALQILFCFVSQYMTHQIVSLSPGLNSIDGGGIGLGSSSCEPLGLGDGLDGAGKPCACGDGCRCVPPLSAGALQHAFRLDPSALLALFP